jgi:hypothetical protein
MVSGVEITLREGQVGAMDKDQTKAPEFWGEALARSDHDIARADVVPALDVHDRLRAALAALQAM